MRTPFSGLHYDRHVAGDNLPAQLTTLIGREHEVGELKEMLAQSRLVTLTGAPGCGKTRLAIAVAADAHGRREFETTLAPGGLRPRHLIALKLLSERGPASQQALADSLSLDPSNVVGLLNELEERKLITRRRDAADRRRHIVELSPRGQKELCDAYDRLRLIDDDLLSPLSARERATLYDLLVRAVGAKTPPCDIPEESADPVPEAKRRR